jgi:hypothetical protein
MCFESQHLLLLKLLLLRYSMVPTLLASSL